MVSQKAKEKITELMEMGSDTFDVRQVGKPRKPGLHTGLGYFEFIRELFAAIETIPGKQLTNAGIVVVVKREYGKYKEIIANIENKNTKASVNWLRHMYNRGLINNPRKTVGPPPHISLRYGIPIQDTDRARETYLGGGKVALVPVERSRGKRQLTREELRDECLYYEIKDDRFFKKEEFKEANWNKLIKDYLTREKGQRKRGRAKRGTGKGINGRTRSIPS